MQLLKPVDNLSKYHYGQIIVEFVDVKELGQGGPDTGIIQIDGIALKNFRFGTNILFYGNYIIGSVYKWSWGACVQGSFKPCVINLLTNGIDFKGNPEILFMPYKVENGTACYWTDLENKMEHSFYI